MEYNEGGIGCSLKKLNYDLRKVKDEIKLRQQKHIEFEKEINQVSYMMQTGPTIETEPVPYEHTIRSGSKRNKIGMSPGLVLEDLEDEGKITCISCSSTCNLL